MDGGAHSGGHTGKKREESFFKMLTIVLRLYREEHRQQVVSRMIC
jgi:hypothetical protein